MPSALAEAVRWSHTLVGKLTVMRAGGSSTWASIRPATSVCDAEAAGVLAMTDLLVGPATAVLRALAHAIAPDARGKTMLVGILAYSSRPVKGTMTWTILVLYVQGCTFGSTRLSCRTAASGWGRSRPSRDLNRGA